MSATYLSKIERGEIVPPSEEKIKAIAQQFAADADEFLGLAGRIPADLSEIIRKQPRALVCDGNAIIALIGRDLQDGIAGCGGTAAEALRDLANAIEREKWPLPQLNVPAAKPVRVK